MNNLPDVGKWHPFLTLMFLWWSLKVVVVMKNMYLKFSHDVQSWTSRWIVAKILGLTFYLIGKAEIMEF